MIRNSIVTKLWLTIIALFIVVLLILSFFLDQLFDNYFVKTEEERLGMRMEHIAAVLSTPEYSWNTSLAIVKELAREEQGVPRVIENPNEIALLLSKLTQSDLHAVVRGQPVLDRGDAPYWSPEQKIESREPHIFVLQPLLDPTGDVSVLLSIAQPVSAAEAVDKVRDHLFFSAALGIVMATGLAFVVSRNLSRPLVQMNKVAEQMAQGNFQGKVEIVTGDEVGQLGTRLNALAHKLEQNIDDLEREKDRLASIITSMTDGVIAADLNGSITLANPPARRYIRAQILAETGSAHDGRLPRDLHEFVQTVMKKREAISDELNWQGRILVVTMVPLCERDGETLRGVVAVLRDITHERTLDKMRQDFIANVSHELRTPLAMMQGYSEALLDEFGDDPEQRQELTQIILDETHRMRRLVNDLLDLAQLESGQFQMNLEEVNMEQLIRRVGRKFATVSHDRDVALEVLIDDCKLPMEIDGDQDRLEQVFTNLIDNAFRHTPQGGRITLALTREKQLVRVSVQDTGEGIPKADLPFVFERFYKVDKARTRSKGGTGLGLSITRNIVKAHHGDIVVDSVAGAGTTFNVLLPPRK